jgi:hypothetical protein
MMMTMIAVQNQDPATKKVALAFLSANIVKNTWSVVKRYNKISDMYLGPNRWNLDMTLYRLVQSMTDMSTNRNSDYDCNIR